MTDTGTAPTTVADRWESNAAYWVEIIRGDHDRYRTGLTDTAVLDSIGPPTGMRILDAGCGEGYLSRMLAALGAEVVGIDMSPQLVRAAQTGADSHTIPNVTFQVADACDLPFPAGSFDLVLCNHLFNDLEDAQLAIDEFSRVLRPGGRLVALMLHPCFYSRHAERSEPMGNVAAASYFQPRRIQQHFVVDGLTSPAEYVAWLRPLEFYTEGLRKAGFTLAALTEPHPTEDQMRQDPWWQKAFSRPLFLLMTGKKLDSAANNGHA